MTIEIDRDKKIIKKTVTGEVGTERVAEIVRELSMAAGFHRGYSILVDVRNTVAGFSTVDILRAAQEISTFNLHFDGKIAFLIPNEEERIRFSKSFKASLEVHGFSYEPFFDREAAIKWLTA